MNTTKKTGMTRLWELALIKKGLVILSCILSVLSVLVAFTPYIAVYLVIRELVSNMNDISGLNTGQMISCGYLAAGGAGAAILLNFGALMCSHLAAFKTLYRLKLDFTQHIASLPLGFHTENSTGKLRKIVDKNIEDLEGFIAHQLPDLAGSFATPLITVILLLIFDWRLGIASLVPVISAYLIQMAAYGGKGSQSFIKYYQDSLEDMNNAAVEYVRGISVVKAFNQTIYSFRKFYDSIKNYSTYVLAYTKMFKNYYGIFIVLINFVFLFLLPVIIWLSDGVTDYPAFALSALFYLIFSFSIPTAFMKVMYVSNKGKQIADGIERMDRIMEVAPLPITTAPKTADSFTVAFEHVVFSYHGEGEAEALSDISFTARQGEVTALVGPSGSGKSTIAHLIPRFYDVNSGAVKIGGVDIRDMSEEYLMSIVSFVFQDVFLFKQSILDNIKIGNANAAREDVVRAAKAAQCHEFIEKLPHGYDTVVGTCNIHLSGGERQRIVIARAILKDAPIIVLDEATAFADPENEQKIQLAFEKLIKNKTVIIIAHRLSTVRNANKILVVDGGKLAEQGIHNELVSKKGRYSHMWEQYTHAMSWTFTEKEVLADAEPIT